MPHGYARHAVDVACRRTGLISHSSENLRHASPILAGARGRASQQQLSSNAGFCHGAVSAEAAEQPHVKPSTRSAYCKLVGSGPTHASRQPAAPNAQLACAAVVQSRRQPTIASSRAFHENLKHEGFERHIDRMGSLGQQAPMTLVARKRSSAAKRSVVSRAPCLLRATLQEVAFKEQLDEIDDLVRDMNKRARVNDALAGAPGIARSAVPPKAGEGGCTVGARRSSAGSSPSQPIKQRPSIAANKQPYSDAADAGSDDDVHMPSQHKANTPARRLNAKLEGGLTLPRVDAVPMRAFKLGKQEVELVDVERLRSRCKGLGQSASVGVILEREKRNEQRQRLMVAAKADLRNRLDVARARGVPLPSQQSYEQRLEQVQQRKRESHMGVMLHRLEQARER